MGKLIIIVVAAALVWSGYWFVGAKALDRGLDRAESDLRDAGWSIVRQDRKTRGFPNRFDTTFTDLQVQSPNGTTIAAPFFQLLALSYRPNQLIAVFPPQIGLDSAYGSATITSERARASMTLQTATSLPLDHSALVVDGLRIESGGSVVSAENLRIATRIPEGAPDASSQNLGVSATDLRLPDRIMQQLRNADLGPIEQIKLDATLQLTAPLDRFAARTVPQITRIELHDLALDWGDIGFSGDGMLEVGADGLPTGTLELTLGNWRKAIEAAVATGLIPASQANSVTTGLMLLTGLGRGTGDLTLPLSFRDGRALLGPIPIGPAPRLNLGG